MLLRSDVQFSETTRKEWIKLLATEMLGFRFALRAEDALFEAFAHQENFSEQEAKALWQTHRRVSNFPPSTEELNEASRNGPANPRVEKLMRSYEAHRKKIIRSNMPSGNNAEIIRVGGLGELLALVFLRDLEPCDCIYHKLTPDNPSMPRHGLDMVGVRFAKNPKMDVVHLLEAKATTGRIKSACDEIVDWFNLKIASRVNMMLESAKVEWERSYSDEVWKRASAALSKYQAGIGNFSYVAAVAYGIENTPTDEEIAGLSEIKAPNQSKLVVFFSMSKIAETASEVFLQCEN